MKYWYLKNGDIIGPLPAEEIAKDEVFAEDSLVCPEDKSEQTEFWKSAQEYAEDFPSLLSEEEQTQMALYSVDKDSADAVLPKEEPTLDTQAPQPQEQEKEPALKPEPKKEEPSSEPQEPTISLPEETLKQDTLSVVQEPPTLTETETLPALDTTKDLQEPTLAQEQTVQETAIAQENKQEDKNPFESDRPQIAPKVEETISNHMIAPRLDADGDTLLEDIPAKAILGPEEEGEALKASEDFIAPSSLAIEDTLEDTPILNIFEEDSKQPHQNKTKELATMTEKEKSLPLKQNQVLSEDQEVLRRKNKTLYLLLIVMFILVGVALLLALFASGNEPKKENSLPLPARLAQQDKQENTETTVEDMLSAPSDILIQDTEENTLEQEEALRKVKNFVLKNGLTLENYLNEKYANFQIDWEVNLLSARNYYVHFYASKIRQEPQVYSFSIDLDKNEINGLNNLGIDLLMKGE